MTDPEATQPDDEDFALVGGQPESDPERRGHFPSDTGTLDYAARCAYVQLMRKTYISFEFDRDHWSAVLDFESELRSRMNDLFLELRVDMRRQIAMKWQVPAENGDVAALIRPMQYTRELAAVMFIAREALLAARTGNTGDGQMREEAWLDVADIVDLALTYPAIGENRSDRLRSRAKTAVEQARKLGVLLGKPEQTRLRVSPVIELLLSTDKLAELAAWFAGDRDGSDAPAIDADARRLPIALVEDDDETGEAAA
ncbi:DUF4194 domain-containing protein [Microbacterium sp. DT81.1]|uniref:DUF4194 domain-containing protein n=1 Tax=Microbacterium sp. DT81.1 TaxID=3393413 RepID=UPI003CF6F8A3